MVMDLYDRQVIQRRWLEAAHGDVRLIEEAVRETNATAKASNEFVTPDMVLEKIKELAAYKNEETIKTPVIKNF